MKLRQGSPKVAMSTETYLRSLREDRASLFLSGRLETFLPHCTTRREPGTLGAIDTIGGIEQVSFRCNRGTPDPLPETCGRSRTTEGLEGGFDRRCDVVGTSGGNSHCDGRIRDGNEEGDRGEE